MPDAGDVVAKRITDVAAGCGISLVATLPDGWITQLISRDAVSLCEIPRLRSG